MGNMLVEFAHWRPDKLPGHGKRAHALKTTVPRRPKPACPRRLRRESHERPILSHWSSQIVFVKPQHRAAGGAAPRAATHPAFGRFLPQKPLLTRTSRPL